jgi:anti-sigma factor RsiW
MCDVQRKLIGWIDRELPADQTGEVERHVERCEECRRWVATYGQLGEAFDSYCDAVMAAKAPRRVPGWMPVLAGAAVAASVMLLAFLRTRVEPPSIVAPAVASASLPNSVTPPAAEPAPRKATMRRRHAARGVQERGTEVQAMDTAIEIAIPAEAMFPPGAVPNGMNFIAELRIAPDGSVKQVRLRQ